MIFDLGAIVQSTGRRGISISISGYWYPYPDPDMQVQWIRSGGESHRGLAWALDWVPYWVPDWAPTRARCVVLLTHALTPMWGAT